MLRAQPQQAVSTMMYAVTHVLLAQASLASIRHHAGWQEHRFLPVIERGDQFVGVLSHAVMVRTLENKAGIKEASARETVGELAFLYWADVSRLIESIVGVLPAKGPLNEKEGKGS